MFQKIIILIDSLKYKYGSSDTKIWVARKRGVKIGKNCILYNNINFGSEPYLISIGNHCTITADVTFITHDGGTWILRENKDFLGSKFGKIIISDNCFIGIRSIIMPNVTIGKNSVIGAGSIVTKSIPDNCVYAGNPASYICSYEEYKNKCKYSNPGDTGLNEHRSCVQKDEIIKLLNGQKKR